MEQPKVNQIIPVKITAGSSLSSVVDLGSKIIVGIELPVSFLASDITIQNSIDNTTYKTVYTPDGNSYIISGVPDSLVSIQVGELVPLQFLRLKTGINQTSSITIKIIARPI